MFADYNGKAYDCPASVPCDAERKQRWICLTVMTDSVVLRSSDLARLRGGRVECGSLNPGPGPSSAPECVNETEEDLLSEMF